MMKSKNLDERQLRQRGDVFQHMCILLFVLLAIDGLLREENIALAPGMWNDMLLLWVAFTLGFSEFIIREITPMGSAMGAIYTIFGAAGAFLVISSAWHIGMGQELFAAAGSLTTCGAALLQGCMMVFLFLLYLGKKCYNHFAAKREEE